MKEIFMDEIKKIELEILKDVAKFCDENAIDYYLAGGTLLGAIRHQGFIPWDDDIDVGMLRKDYDRLMEIFDKELGEHYELLTPEIDSRYACTVTHVQRKNTVFISEMTKDLKCNCRIFMDIFPFDNIPESVGFARVITGMSNNRDDPSNHLDNPKDLVLANVYLGPCRILVVRE